MFQKDFLEKIEFDKILELLEKKFVSELGVDRMNESIFFEDQNDLYVELVKVLEYKKILDLEESINLSNIYKIEGFIEKMNVENYFLLPEAFSKIRNNCIRVSELQLFFKNRPSNDEFPKLYLLAHKVFYNSDIIKKIHAVIDDENQIKSDASPELKNIRGIKSTINKDIDSKFRKLVDLYKEKGVLSDTNESVRNGRRVLAVASEKKRQVKGIIHDESESGKIVYIEPEEIVWLHNESFEIEQNEKREIRRILIQLTQNLVAYKDLILSYQELLKEFDWIYGKAILAREIEATMPKLTSKKLNIIKGYHPLLKIKNSFTKKVTVPFSVKMEDSNLVLLISGPNAGGKSITLKSIALLAIMTKFGLLIPAEEGTEMPLYKDFYCDIGDNQSIEDEMSTYSSKLNIWNHILAHADEQSLILFDEMGTGTDPSFGGAIAQVVLEECIKKKATTVATTHFGTLKTFGSSHPNIINGAMLFDEKKLEPTYQLSIGKPGSSFTFQIAEKNKLNKRLIERAKELSNTEQLKYDRFLHELEVKENELNRSLKQVAQKEQELKDQMKKWSRLNLDAELLNKRMKYEKMNFTRELNLQKEKELNQHIESLKIISKVDDLKVQKKQIQENLLENQKDIKELFIELNNIDPNQSLKVGDQVSIIETQAIGVIEKIEKKHALVQFDHMKTKVMLKDLVIHKKTSEEEPKKSKRNIHVQQKQMGIELDLRGLYRDEAIGKIDEFVNYALINNIWYAKIIHGKGTLKKEVLKYLKGVSQIDNFHHPELEMGGDGATIINF
jgi:DNA mismatch repair protein MutS2